MLILLVAQGSIPLWIGLILALVLVGGLLTVLVGLVVAAVALIRN